MIWGAGGAAAVTMVRPARFWPAAAGDEASAVRTVGAPHRWVTPSAAMRRYTSAGSTRRKHTCVPPTAVPAPQTPLRPPHRRAGPREAPAVTVEHRQRPEIDRLRVEPELERFAQRV